jgi:hypothetical protein
MEKIDPGKLEISVGSAGHSQWTWRLVAGSRSVRTGTMNGATREKAIAAAQEERLSLISKGQKV